MDGLDVLWLVYDWWPVAFFIDYLVMQGALRWGYWRSNSRSRS